MSADRYTRIMLTIIAMSLTIIALRPFFSPVLAGTQPNGCGLDAHHPSYVSGWGAEGTNPIANSVHSPLKVLVANPAANAVPVILVNPSIALSHK
jgi:hypothetical protein